MHLPKKEHIHTISETISLSNGNMQMSNTWTLFMIQQEKGSNQIAKPLYGKNRKYKQISYSYAPFKFNVQDLARFHEKLVYLCTNTFSLRIKRNL